VPKTGVLPQFQEGIQRIIILWFASMLSMGFFQLSTIPIFEGFDESGHYSAIRQIAYVGKIPMRDESYMDVLVHGYQGPLPYDSGTPPFDRGMVYGKFVRDQRLVDAYRAQYRETAPPARFVPSAEPNNLYRQHPAIYYVLMAPILRLVDGTSMVTQVFILRLVSYLLALSGVALGIVAICKRHSIEPGEHGSFLLLGFLIYPFLLPMFFLQFARLGIDSLCLFLVGLLAYLLSRWLESGREPKFSLSIGVVLGAGLLTKAFFIPVALAIFMYLLIPAFAALRVKPDLSKQTVAILTVFLPAVAIGGGWYVYNYVMFGSYSGSNLGIWLAQRGGLLANLGGTFTWAAFGRGLATAGVTYIWGGTQSLAHLPYLLYVPLLAAVVSIFAAFCFRLAKLPLLDPLWLSMWLAVFFALGICWHAASNLAINGNANTPGWYFHILSPFLAPAIGVGVHSLFRYNRSRKALLAIVVYGAIFTCLAAWFQLALFSGCATKGADKHYLFPSQFFCVDNASMVVDGINLLGYPVLAGLGLCCWVVASVLLFAELWRIRLWGSD
jgi:hypothetical protein